MGVAAVGVFTTQVEVMPFSLLKMTITTSLLAALLDFGTVMKFLIVADITRGFSELITRSGALKAVHDLDMQLADFLALLTAGVDDSNAVIEHGHDVGPLHFTPQEKARHRPQFKKAISDASVEALAKFEKHVSVALKQLEKVF